MRGSDDEEDHTEDEEGNAAFSSSWLLGRLNNLKNRTRRGKRRFCHDEDVVEDFVLSTDEEDGYATDMVPSDEEDDENRESSKEQKKTKPSTSASKNKKTHPKKSRKRKEGKF
ncbi:hypothetical protein L484_010918 [Morus notabilis]|uniref:Uncharacterized protein n=1 Tax=Morus notabilis TaxID=981085 RepID=W9RRV2_9ROSA|nr:hypothetical protein L484_010918 [Morus notabilis]